MALVADAAHNLGDVAGLGIAWFASGISKQPATSQRSYGLRSATILAALINSTFLLVTVGGIGWEAISRLANPQPIETGVVMTVASLGVLLNGATALLFMRGQHDLNIRGAFLHMAADAAISAGVVLAALAIQYSGWLLIDPVVSLAIVAIVMLGTWSMFRDSVNLALHAVPPGIELEAVRTFFRSLPGVMQVHDLHVWGLSTTDAALTVHLVKSDLADDQFLFETAKAIQERFGISHATIQIETGDPAFPCSLANGDEP